MSGIEARRLCFSYGNQAVLRDVSFRHASGVLCVLGPNGVGKSTLFRCLLGLSRGYTGEVWIEGRDVKTCPPKELAGICAYVPQSQSPPSGYTVLEMVLMGAGRGLFPPGRAQRQTAMAALTRMGMDPLATRDYRKISGGERQLALIARALAQGARVMVMDEPTANLDYGNQIRVLDEIRRLAEEGFAIVLSTHHPEQALRYADRVLALHDGVAVAQGAPEDVLDAALIERLYGAKVRMERTLEGRLIVVPV